MTEHKHKKQLVRERMARTGETYSTALRHVAPSRPADGEHHESTLLVRLLDRAGYRAPHTGRPYSEALACGLGGGIGFMYATFEYRGVPPILTIVAQHHPEPWVPGALGRLGIGYTEEHGAAKAALAALHRYVDADRAVLCWVASSFPTEPRTVLVVGRTDAGFLVDEGGPAPVPMAEADFVAAWSGYKKGRHHRLVLDPPGPAVDLPAALRASLATTAGHLTGPVLGNSFDANFGFSGMGRLAAQLRDASTKAGWVARFAAPDAFAYAVRRLYRCLECEYTAPGATRPLYAEFLDEAAGVLDDNRLAEAAELVRGSADAWSEIATQASGAADGLGELPELAEQRAMTRLVGQDATELEARIAALVPVPLPDLAAFFAELAELVDTARSAEEQAVRLFA